MLSGVYSVVYDVVSYGNTWCGMLSGVYSVVYDVVSYGDIWCGMLSGAYSVGYDVVSYGDIWCGMLSYMFYIDLWYDYMMWHVMVRYDVIYRGMYKIIC